MHSIKLHLHIKYTKNQGGKSGISRAIIEDDAAPTICSSHPIPSSHPKIPKKNTIETPQFPIPTCASKTHPASPSRVSPKI